MSIELENAIIMLSIVAYSLGGIGGLYYWFIYRPKYFMEVINWSKSAGFEHHDYEKAKRYFENRSE